MNKHTVQSHPSLSNRELYSGTSFRVSEWKENAFYSHDIQNIDFVSYKGCLLYCLKNHGSNESNKPEVIIKNNVAIGIATNQYWNFVFGGTSNAVSDVEFLYPMFRVNNNNGEISWDDGITWVIVGASTEVVSNGIKNINNQYYLSTYQTSLQDGVGSDILSTNTANKFIGTRWKTELYNGTVTYSEPICVSGKNGSDGVSGAGSFKSIVFTRNNNKPATPSGGSYKNPIPDGDIWTDGIPEDTSILWASSRTFSTNSELQDASWTSPKQLTDTSSFDVEYSSLANPGLPQGHPNYVKGWSNTATTDTIGMATSVCTNGVGSDGVMHKIKGEAGDSTAHLYALSETETLPTALQNNLDSYSDNFQSDNYVPVGGSTVIQDVDSTYPYQFVTYRTKKNGIGSRYAKPVHYNRGIPTVEAPATQFTSFVFTCTSNVGIDGEDELPSGGTYDEPIPNENGTIGGQEVIGEDSIPKGTPIGMSKRTFYSDGRDSEGSTPTILADSTNFQVEFYHGEVGNGKLDNLGNYNSIDAGEEANPGGTNNGENAYYMATCTFKLGKGSDGTVSKIRGENGNNGTPINVVGDVETYSELPACGTYSGNPGDAYVVRVDNGKSNVLYVFSGDNENCGIYVGPINAQGAYLHIKYATENYYTHNNETNDFDENGGKYWAGSDGETPGPYIGIYTDSNPDDSSKPGDYKWKKWNGEDGGGYEYIYKTQQSSSAPDIPIYGSEKGWSDNPEEVSATNQYCFMCYRKTEEKAGTGSKNNTGKALLWSHYGSDGVDGDGIEYVYILDNKDPYVNGKIEPPEHINEITVCTAVQSSDYCPEYGVYNVVYKGLDNPPQVTFENQYCGESIRKKTNGKWGTFQPPTLRNRYVSNGGVFVTLKIWQRSNTKLNSGVVEYDSTYTLGTDEFNFEDSKWKTSIPDNSDGRYLYSMSTRLYITEPSQTFTINKSDWKDLTLESVDGSNGIAENNVYITVDPDSITLNIDEYGKTRYDTLIMASANYYYGSSLKETTFSYIPVDGITIEHNEGSNTEHPFTITIAEGKNTDKMQELKITLTPIDSDFSPLSRKIYLSPIMSTDKYELMLSQDQVIVPASETWSKVITVTVIKNNQVYDGDDIKLILNDGSDITESKQFTLNQNSQHLEYVVTLVVGDESILKQSVSILKNGESIKGDPGNDIIRLYQLSSVDTTSFEDSGLRIPNGLTLENISENKGDWKFEPQTVDAYHPICGALTYVYPKFSQTASWVPSIDAKYGYDSPFKEYIYYRVKGTTAPTGNLLPDNNGPYQDPRNGGTNDPQGVSETYLTEYECQRTKNKFGVWGDGSAPVIHQQYVTDGKSIQGDPGLTTLILTYYSTSKDGPKTLQGKMYDMKNKQFVYENGEVITLGGGGQSIPSSKIYYKVEFSITGEYSNSKNSIINTIENEITGPEPQEINDVSYLQGVFENNVDAGVVLTNVLAIKNNVAVVAGLTPGQIGEKNYPLIFAGASSLAGSNNALFKVTTDGLVYGRGFNQIVKSLDLNDFIAGAYTTPQSPTPEHVRLFKHYYPVMYLKNNKFENEKFVRPISLHSFIFTQYSSHSNLQSTYTTVNTNMVQDLIPLEIFSCYNGIWFVNVESEDITFKYIKKGAGFESLVLKPQHAIFLKPNISTTYHIDYNIDASSSIALTWEVADSIPINIFKR